MIISHKHKFIFIHTNKCAGTSVEVSLSSICGSDDIIGPVTLENLPPDYKHPENYDKNKFEDTMKAKDIKSNIPIDCWKEYTKFSVVRNPWERMVSAWFWQTRNDDRDLSIFLSQPVLRPISLSEQFVSKIRKAVEDKCDILIGTHGQMTSASAVRLAKKLEQYDPLWFEEPVPPDNIEAMSLVASKTSIPIATGERLSTKYEFSKVIQNKAASIIQFNLGRVGGILEAKKISAIAEANGLQIAPHLYCGPIVASANIQIASCIPNFLILESIGKMEGIYNKILKKPIQWQDGYIVPPKEPGLGIEIDENAISKYPYLKKNLHLEVSDEIIDF